MASARLLPTFLAPMRSARAVRLLQTPVLFMRPTSSAAASLRPTAAAGAAANSSTSGSTRPVAAEATASATTAEAAATATTARPGFLRAASIALELSKARLSALVVLTSGAGFLLAGGPVDACALAAVTGGTALAACSANTWNQLREIETDALMHRTRGRPLPSGRATRGQAAAWDPATPGPTSKPGLIRP